MQITTYKPIKAHLCTYCQHLYRHTQALVHMYCKYLHEFVKVCRNEDYMWLYVNVCECQCMYLYLINVVSPAFKWWHSLLTLEVSVLRNKFSERH